MFYLKIGVMYSCLETMEDGLQHSDSADDANMTELQKAVATMLDSNGI